MKRAPFFYIIIVTVLLFTGCSTHPESENILTKEAFLNFIEDNDFFHLKNFENGIEGDLTERIYTAPDLVVDYLNQVEGTANLAAYTLSETEIQQVKDALEKLPDLNKQVLTENLQGIYFIKNWKGAAMLDITLTEDREIKNVLIVNPETLNQTASEWLSFRENSTFKDKNKFTVQVTVSEDLSALDYALLHESFHAVDLHKNMTPGLFPLIQTLTGKRVKETPFTKDVWVQYRLPNEKYDYPDRDRLEFYYIKGKPRIPEGRAVRAYTDMERTPFVSLYGSVNWAEDFAEFMTMYTLTRINGSPYEVTILKRDEVVYSGSPMEKSILASRIAQAEELLK